MNRIDVFYQCEGYSETGQIEVEADATFATVKTELVKRHSLGEEVSLYLEDADDLLDENRQVRDCSDLTVIMVHLNRCHHIAVNVTFNGKTIKGDFGPSSTIARIKQWAAEGKFGLHPEDACEHYLQLVDTQDRPTPGTHIGRLACCPDCNVAFDLVPDELVNGSIRSTT